MTTPEVFHYYSELVDSPVLNGVAGSGIAMLDACLVDGFGLKTVDSLVVSGGKATISLSLGHPFAQNVVVQVAGAGTAGLNGLKRIESRTTNTATFDAAGIPDGAASGTITVKIAPAGWEKVFSATNVAVYRSTDVASTRFYLRVDDSNPNNMRVIGYESMTDVNTGTGPFPTNDQVSGGGYWAKANNTSTGARPWTIRADGRGFSYFVSSVAGSGGASGSVWSFGDFDPVVSADLFNCHISVSLTAAHTTTATPNDTNDMLQAEVVGGVFVPRSITGAPGAIRPILTPSSLGIGGTSGKGIGTVQVYPHPGAELITVSKLLIESGVCLRGSLRGELYTPQNCHASLTRHQQIDGTGPLAGRKLLTIKCGGTAWTTSFGAMFFDITGQGG